LDVSVGCDRKNSINQRYENKIKIFQKRFAISYTQAKNGKFKRVQISTEHFTDLGKLNFLMVV
jgi:hypothetical protein